MTFNEKLQLREDASRDLAAVGAALDRVRPRGGTALIDALYVCLKRRWGTGRPLVVLFTDGQDSASWLDNEDVLEAARESSALLQVVGTEALPERTRPLVLPRGRIEPETESGYVYLLRRAAETTGGAYWPVESIASLPAAFLRILEASAARYVLRYEPTGVPRVGRHRLKVSVRRRGVEVRARQEYTVSAAPPRERAYAAFGWPRAAARPPALAVRVHPCNSRGMPRRFIEVEKARQNNLKGVSVRVPIGAVTAVTGVAGAGKSSLAFDVLYAEGHRRYAETFSPYARQFLERLDRPRAERIEGVLPAVAVDRTAPVRTSRSTVGTMTSVADYLRALYARAATLHCRQCGQPVRRDTPSSIFEALVDGAEGRSALVCFPHRVGSKGGDRRRARGLREGGVPSGARGWRGETDRGGASPRRGRRDPRSCSTASRSSTGSASGSWTRSRPRCATGRGRSSCGSRARLSPAASARPSTARPATSPTPTRRPPSSRSTTRWAPARPARASAAPWRSTATW